MERLGKENSNVSQALIIVVTRGLIAGITSSIRILAYDAGEIRDFRE